MIKSFEMERFRAFEHLAISGLRSVNVIVGRSASGKTALLEGVRRHGADARVALATVLGLPAEDILVRGS
jgi:recombinational DNA repair ATPase RecF